LYGGGNGNIFKVNKDGTCFTNLHVFSALAYSTPAGLFGPSTNYDGAEIQIGLALSSNMLYGAASGGGTNGAGTIFAICTNGTGFTVLHTFGSFPGDGSIPAANDYHNDSLILVSNTLYGATSGGGTNGAGTIFAINTDGTGYTNLYNFVPSNTGYPYNNYPNRTLVLVGNTLFGATGLVGSDGFPGYTFSINTDGTGFQTGVVIPQTVQILANTAYGTDYYGGTWGNGAIYAVNTNGTGGTNLYNFSASANNIDGELPNDVTLSGYALYGTAEFGGSNGQGTLFSLSFLPQLAISYSGTNVVLTWPTNVAGFDYSGFTLQSTTNLGSTAYWNTNLPAPTVVGAQNVITNPISGTQMFYRLKHLL
jgi:uncharacterized repeat protein (TIGR03803 family)